MRRDVDPDVVEANDREDRLPGYKWEELRVAAMERDQYKCVECEEKATDVDHIVPIALCGTNDLDNLQSLCAACHKKKTLEDNERARRSRKMRKYKSRIGGFD